MSFLYFIKWRLYDIKSWIKGKSFALIYGFDYRDCWSLDYSLAKWILPRLKYFRKNLRGYPSGLTLEQWEEYIDKMIWSFEFILKEDDYLGECWPKDFDFGFKTDEEGKVIWNDNRKADFYIMEEYEKKYDIGMELFKKYFKNLWD